LHAAYSVTRKSGVLAVALVVLLVWFFVVRCRVSSRAYILLLFSLSSRSRSSKFGHHTHSLVADYNNDNDNDNDNIYIIYTGLCEYLRVVGDRALFASGTYVREYQHLYMYDNNNMTCKICTTLAYLLLCIIRWRTQFISPSENVVRILYYYYYIVSYIIRYYAYNTPLHARRNNMGNINNSNF